MGKSDDTLLKQALLEVVGALYEIPLNDKARAHLEKAHDLAERVDLQRGVLTKKVEPQSEKDIKRVTPSTDPGN